MLDCRKWRRQRDAILRSLNSNKKLISGRQDQADLRILFEENAIEHVLRFIEGIEVGKKLAEGANDHDTWDIDRLGRGEDEGAA